MYKVRQLLALSTVICSGMWFQTANATRANGYSMTAQRELARQSPIILAQAAEPESKPGSAPQKPPTAAPSKPPAATPTPPAAKGAPASPPAAHGQPPALPGRPVAPP